LKKNVTAMLALSASIGLMSAAPASAADAETKVTIKGPGNVFGFVSSDRLNKCAKDRKVKIYKQKGDIGGGNDTYTGLKYFADDKQGDRYKWDAGNPGLNPGKYYARAPKIDGCRADNSQTLVVP
jgi:hypothetical protein